MASTRRDVELALRVATPGAEKVDELADSFGELSGEAGKLGATGASGAKGLAELTARTRELRQAEAAATADMRAARQAVREKQDALALLGASYQRTGGDTAKYRQEQRQLRAALAEAQVALRQKRDALGEAAETARRAAMTERALSDQVKATAAQQSAAVDKAGDGYKRLTDQLSQLRNIAAAVVGGQALGGLAGDISRTADEYANLAARIKLVTGEGAAFNDAFNGVFDVAQRTNTAVETTGTLFARVAQAGKAIGVSTTDALRLTEAINQAAQLSGASAEASNAAITQLIQGLQSGVLCGEEFNSVMEQAPRLAQALATGLGVTTGELRKLAEAGTLTSATVIGALQGQSAALQSEFEKLPATVGRAITNLGTAWTRYIGEADQANGVSAVAANTINGLARNLDTVAGLLYSAGKAAAAYKAVNLAQTILAQSSATAASTAATVADTAATTANTAAKRANAVATAAAGDSAVVSGGKLAGFIGSLKVGALALVVTNLRELGTAIGEGVAKWAGYGKAIAEAESRTRAEEEATRAAASAKAALAQQLQITADRALGLTAESKKLVSEFEGLRLKGESTAESLEKLTKALKVGDIQGITAAGSALDALGIKGELTADQIRTAWTRALRDIDLGVFSAQARAAFGESEQGARRLADAMDGALREAVRRAGLDFQLITSGMGAASQSASNDLQAIIDGLDRLRRAGADTSQALTASISKAIDNADSHRAIEALSAQIESVRRVLGDKVADGFLDQAAAKALELKDALDKALPGVQSLREAYRQLGLQAPEDLARIANANKQAWETIKADGRATADVLGAAFARYAQSVLDAAGTAGRATAEASLRAEGAAKGLEVQFDNTGRMIVRRAGESVEAIDRITRSTDRSTDAIERQSAALQKLHDRYRNSTQTGTNDGFLKGPDGAAAGTFTNTLPVDRAFDVVNRSQRGETVSLEDARAGFEQARAAFQDMQAFMKLNPGAASFDYIQSTTELFTAARTAFERVQAPRLNAAVPSPSPSTAATTTRTVNIQIGGRTTAVNVASQQDSDALVGLLRQIETVSTRAA